MTYNYQPIAAMRRKKIIYCFYILCCLPHLFRLPRCPPSLSRGLDNRSPAVVHDFGAHNHSPAVDLSRDDMDLSRDKLLNYRAISDDNYRAINSDENLWFVKALQGHRKIKKRNKDIKTNHNKGHNQVSQRSVGAMTTYVYL